MLWSIWARRPGSNEVPPRARAWRQGMKGMLLRIGGLEHEFYDLPYNGNNHPNWLIFFQRGSNHQPDMFRWFKMRLDCFWFFLNVVGWFWADFGLWITVVQPPPVLRAAWSQQVVFPLAKILLWRCLVQPTTLRIWIVWKWGTLRSPVVPSG